MKYPSPVFWLSPVLSPRVVTSPNSFLFIYVTGVTTRYVLATRACVRARGSEKKISLKSTW
jgi:hypothetical protein